MSGLVADPQVDAALEKIDLENYLDREGIGYRFSSGTRGQQLVLDECPFCGEGGGKTYVGLKTGLGNCFHGSCGEKFNKRKLMRKISGLAGKAFDDYVKAVAEEMGWMPKKVRPEVIMAELKLPKPMDALPHMGRQLAYLARRGVTPESSQWFHLGYCHDKAWWGYKLDDGTEKWVNYARRVIIPIFDLDGTLVSFQGRDTTGEKEPKYLFPVGYAVAGRHLYNGNAFEDGVHTHAVVGEGAFDAIAIHQAVTSDPGCRSMLALATFGMHLSGGENSQLDRFARLRDRGLTTVTLMWDGEGRAIAGSVKAGLLLIGLGLQVRIATLPEGYDPAQGPDGAPTPPELVRKAIFEAVPLTKLNAIKILAKAKLGA